jgi:hypothetical protein
MANTYYYSKSSRQKGHSQYCVEYSHLLQFLDPPAIGSYYQVQELKVQNAMKCTLNYHLRMAQRYGQVQENKGKGKISDMCTSSYCNSGYILCF